tara:strand:+ start:145 stop:999 length:855 start_codon:yes stop_codon:yes gene_type:complete
MKKIAVTTWVTDDYIDFIGLNELRNSFKYFHPDVDFFVFDTKMTNEAKEKDPWINRVWMMPPSCMPYIDDYDMVVHIDGDCVVTGPLTELFESDEDIIGVRNNNSFDKASSHKGITIRHLPPFGNGEFLPVQGFINAGLVASNNKEFWHDWHALNKEAYRIKQEVSPYFHGLGDEQDSLNQLFHWGKYSTKIIDAMGTGLSYGLCNTWGEEYDNHWESWKDLYVKDGALYLDDPVNGDIMSVKVLHQAGGGLAAELNKKHGGLRNWFKTVVNEEVLDYINKVTK